MIVGITGATRGIGRNMAIYFARQGHVVIGTGRNEELLAELEQELKRYATQSATYSLDVLNLQQFHTVSQAIFERYGKLDVWINNAGSFTAIGPVWEIDPADWTQDVSINLFGVFHSMQAVLPLMIRQQFGRMINVVGGGTGGEFKFGSGYGVSKTAIARLTENAAAELAGQEIYLFAMDPGLNDTDMTRYQRETEAGRRYLPQIELRFQEKRDVPRELAPKLAYQLAIGSLDTYHGRIVSVNEDLEKLIRNASDLANDEAKLRIIKKLDTRK